MKKWYLQIAILFVLISINSTSGSNYDSWGYQLQNFSISELSNSPYDLLVIDYSFDGSDEEALTSTEVHNIQSSSKFVISYISIGEAEDYRYYFDSNWIENSPEWFDGENPDWEGNFKVKYWYSEWQEIIFDYIDKIIGADFNGLYLDIIDAYEFYEDVVPNADELMMDFVIDIAEYGKSQSIHGNDFLIIPQNGDPLLNNQTYLNTVDGIGREDVYIDSGEKRDNGEIIEIEDNLDLLVEINKDVFVVDYTSDPDLIKFARDSAAQKGYTHYIGTLDLDRLLEPDYSGTEDDSFFQIYPIFITLALIMVIKKHNR